MKIIKSFFILLFCFSASTVSAQDLLVYKSQNLPRLDSTWVFTPKRVETGKRLPLIFLLHGYSGNYKQWHSIMDAQSYADKYGFIIVTPDGLYNSWYINSPRQKNSQFEDFFMKELYTDVVKKYNVDTENIFITGLSMGGHGALSIFLNNIDKFKSAGSTSGAVDLSTLGTKYGIDQLFDNPELTLLKQFSVVGNIHKLKGSAKEIIFDSGDQDQFYSMNNALKVTTDELKIKATYISQPGAHNRAYWSKSIRQQFEFFKAQTTNILN